MEVNSSRVHVRRKSSGWPGEPGRLKRSRITNRATFHSPIVCGMVVSNSVGRVSVDRAIDDAYVAVTSFPSRSRRGAVRIRDETWVRDELIYNGLGLWTDIKTRRLAVQSRR